MENLIACRPESYGRYADRAFESLPRLGIQYVEIPAPALSDVESTREKLNRYGLKASSVTLRTPLQDPDFLARVAEVGDAASALNATIIFTSQHSRETDRKEVYHRLRQAGEVLSTKSAILVLETHPDLCNNARVAVETMRGIDHPNVRVNFDPANIHYYNQNVNAVTEMEQVAPYVKAMHLKDTNGGFQAHHFPAIGDGVVDWKTLFRMMNDRGMYGPFTLEMEGIAGEELTYEETHARIERSLAYLRSAGLMG